MKPLLTLFVIALLVSCQSNPPATTETATSTLPPNARVLDPENKPPKSQSRIEQHDGNSNSLQTALVIGNSHYDYSPLQNPVNDAKAMTQRLVEMGFSVTQGTNLNYQKMQEVVQAFEKRLSGTPETVALFYFSGHGAQVDGQNFLLPVNNNDIKGEADLEKQAVLAQNVLAMMKKTNTGMNLLVLDACRNNPFEGSIRSPDRGLARMAPPRGAVIAFAAAPGQVASDGDGHYGLYTSHLLNALKNAAHKRIEDVFMEIYDPVVKESGQAQEPWYQASLRKPFCFGGCR